MIQHNLHNLILFVELHNNLAYLILFLWSIWDALFPISFLVYWEIYFLAWSILAWYWILNIYLLIFVLLSWWFIWDNISYYMWYRYWNKIIWMLKKTNLLKDLLRKDKIEKINDFVQKKWWLSVLIARFSWPLSRVTPFFVWIFKLKYKEFIKYDILWVIGWIWSFIIVGYFFWKNIQKVFLFFWNYLIIIIWSIICVFLLYMLIKKNIEKWF